MKRKLRLRVTEKHPVGKITATAVGGAAILGAAYLAMRSLPELVRYMRLRRM
jgi:hypothetical protein